MILFSFLDNNNKTVHKLYIELPHHHEDFKYVLFDTVITKNVKF